MCTIKWGTTIWKHTNTFIGADQRHRLIYKKFDGKERNNTLSQSEKHFLKWASALNDLELNAAARPSLPLHPPGVHRSPLCSSSSSAIPIPPLCSRVCLFQYLTGPVEVHRYAPRAAESDGWPTYQAGSGGSCLILIAEPFLPASHPAVHSPGHSLQHCGQPGGALLQSGVPLCPLPRLGEESNLLCGATRHDRANVHWEVNEMAILMSVYTTIWESRY